MKVVTKIQKWGNSLGLRIPKTFADELSIAEGTAVEIALRGGSLSIKPVRPPRYRLEELLEQVSETNLHEEIQTGSPVGREIL